MSVQVLAAILGEDAVAAIPEEEIPRLSAALVRAIEADPPAKERLLAAISEELARTS